MAENAHSAIDSEIVKNEYVTLLDSILGKKFSEVDKSILGVDRPYQPSAYSVYDQSLPFQHESGVPAYMARMIAQIATPEGMRFYPGEGISKKQHSSIDKARLDAESQSWLFPSDSLSTDIVNQLIQHGDLFK